MKVCPSDNLGSPRESILPGRALSIPPITTYNMNRPQGRKVEPP